MNVSARSRSLLLGVLIGLVLDVVAAAIVPAQPYLGAIPLLLGFLLASPLRLLGAGNGWPEIRLISTPVLFLNLVAWALIIVGINALRKRKASA